MKFDYTDSWLERMQAMRYAREQEIIARREARKAATIERNRQKRIAAGKSPDPISHAERRALREAHPPKVSKLEQQRAEKQFAAEIGLSWCCSCKAWLPISNFWKGCRSCKKHAVRKTGMTREQRTAKHAELRAEKQRVKQACYDEREDMRVLCEIKKHWHKVVLPLFWEMTKEERKEQELETKRKWQRKWQREKSMKAAGCRTDEEYQIYLAGKGDRLAAKKIGKPVEELEAHRRERGRIRDQWRNYRKQVKAGMGANGGRIPAGWMKSQIEYQGGMCALCWTPLDDKFEIDHIIPVCYGGENVAENLQLIHPLCNARKNNNMAACFAE